MTCDYETRPITQGRSKPSCHHRLSRRAFVVKTPELTRKDLALPTRAVDAVERAAQGAETGQVAGCSIEVTTGALFVGARQSVERHGAQQQPLGADTIARQGAGRQDVERVGGAAIDQRVTAGDDLQRGVARTQATLQLDVRRPSAGRFDETGQAFALRREQRTVSVGEPIDQCLCRRQQAAKRSVNRRWR